MFVFHQHEHLDALMDLVKGVAECIVLGAGHRIFKVPGQHLSSPWKGMAFQRRFIAQRDDVIETLARKLIDRLAVQPFGTHT